MYCLNTDRRSIIYKIEMFCKKSRTGLDTGPEKNISPIKRGKDKNFQPAPGEIKVFTARCRVGVDRNRIGNKI